MEKDDKDLKWQDTDPRQKDDRSELLKKTSNEEKEERKEQEDVKEEDLSEIWGTGSDGGAEGDGAAA